MDKIFLEFIKGPKQGTHVTLQNGYMIGRDNACEIYIDDNSISKRHAVFEIVEKQVVIKDVGSSNGTFVNGRKVEKAALSHNDEISIGRSIAKIMFEGVDKEAAASPERTAMEKKIFPEPSKEESQKGAEKKKKTLKVLMLTVVAFVVILLVFIVMKSMISSRESKKPVSLVYTDYHDIRNRYMVKIPKGWKQSTISNTYFRETGAFDGILVKFAGSVEGQSVAFAVDRLEGFSYDSELKNLVDFTSVKYPRFAADMPRNIIQSSQIDVDGIPGIFVESTSVNKKSGFVMHFFEVYLLVKNYLVLESEKVKYGIPHNTRYILVLMVPERLAPRIRHAFQDILEGFDIIPNLPPKNTVTNITRSQLFTLYEEKIKRAEYLLERTTIDVGNQFRALLDYKSAIWIAIEYENLGGSSKYRSDLIKKTVEMNEDLKKQYTTCQFNIKKGFALRNRNLIRESAEKIMELFPDPENYKHIEAKRVYNQFRKR